MTTLASPLAEDRPRRILFVDDDPSIRTVADAVLRQHGYEVLLAEDGAKALEQYRLHSSIDLVILDLALPNESGGDVLRRLRQFDPALRVLISSGTAADEEAAALAAGHIKKPYRLQELLDAVDAALHPSAGS